MQLSERGLALNAGDDKCARHGAVTLHYLSHTLEHAALAHPPTQMTTLRPCSGRGEVRRFRRGMDYTVAHHGVLAAAPCLDAVLCMLGSSSETGVAAWEGGEVGGYEAYMLADDEGEGGGAAAATAEVYRSPGDAAGEAESGVLNISPASNCLSLVLRDEETELLKFVKYVSASAPGSRWDVSVVSRGEGFDEGKDDVHGTCDGEEEGLLEGSGKGG